MGVVKNIENILRSCPQRLVRETRSGKAYGGHILYRPLVPIQIRVVKPMGDINYCYFTGHWFQYRLRVVKSLEGISIKIFYRTLVPVQVVVVKSMEDIKYCYFTGYSLQYRLGEVKSIEGISIKIFYIT